MRIRHLFSAFILSLSLLSPLFGAQKVIRCSTMDVFRRRSLSDPGEIQRKEQMERDIQQWIQNNAALKSSAATVITIPVVVHVVWNTSQQNISDAQILSQIDRLNKDFRKLNTDMVPSGHPFYSLAGDAGIEFCLARVDPNGNPTTGITRYHTSDTAFTDNDDVKDPLKGGVAAWDATQYLNLWVCHLSGDLLGYAQFPSDLGTYPETDGVVIGYTNFGYNGTAEAPYDLGRTATHEIGHWLNLEHIWGDDEGTANECSGSDHVGDTPNQQVPTYDCLSGTQTDNCSSTSPGFMYENYMDYTDDACMVMFTNGQVNRMAAVFSVARSAIKTSNKCSGPTYVNQQSLKALKIYPNPIENYLTIEGLPKSSKPFNIGIYNVIGEKVYSAVFEANDKLLEMQGLKTGTYIMMIFNDEFSATQKITVVK